MHVLTADNTWKEQQMLVDASVNQLRLVSAGRQWDADVDNVCEGYHRKVEVLQPGGTDRDWIPVSPPDQKLPPPATWDIRNSYYVDVVLVLNPTPGLWKIRTKYYYGLCQQAQVLQPVALETDFLMNGAVQSLIRLEGRFLDPYADSQGATGEYMPIVAALMQKTGALSGAVVAALVERPGSGSNTLLLRDDGLHNDGATGDSIYGTIYPYTAVGGVYNVTIAALFPDPAGSGAESGAGMVRQLLRAGGR